MTYMSQNPSPPYRLQTDLSDTIKCFASSAVSSENFSMYSAPARKILGSSFACPIIALQFMQSMPRGLGGSICLWSAHALDSFCFMSKFKGFPQMQHVPFCPSHVLSHNSEVQPSPFNLALRLASLV